MSNASQNANALLASNVEAPVSYVQPRLNDVKERHPVPGRECGTCTMCCKLYPVPVVNKPAQKWCQHCKPGKGCGIWETRPQFCRDFHCHWILDANVGPEWKPEISKFIMNFQTSNTLWILVDASDKLAWKREPYYSVIKRWSVDFIDAGGYIIVGDGRDTYCITPDEDVIVGRYGGNNKFRVQVTKVGQIKAYQVLLENSAAA